MSSAPSPLSGALALVGTVVPLVVLTAISAAGRATPVQIVQYVALSGLGGLSCASIGALLRDSPDRRKFTALSLASLGALGVLLCLAHPHDFVEPWVGLSVLVPAAGASAMVIVLSFVFGAHRRLLGWRPGSILYDLDRRRIELVAATTIAVAAWLVSLAEPTLVGAAASIGALIVVAAVFVVDHGKLVLLRRVVTASGRVVDPTTSGEVQWDLGVGEERRLAVADQAGPYRESALPPLLLGSVSGAMARAASVVRGDRAALGFAAFAALHVSLRALLHPSPEPSPPPPTVHEPVPVPAALPVVQHVGAPYPMQAPIWADLNDDGIEDVVTLRWASHRPEAALFVTAHDGKSLTPLWATEPLPSQWMSPRTHLVRKDDILFLTDSEGQVWVHQLASGRLLAARFRMDGTTGTMCVPEGLPRLWFEASAQSKGPGGRDGFFLDPGGNLSPAKQPERCVTAASWSPMTRNGAFDDKCAEPLGRRGFGLATRHDAFGLAERAPRDDDDEHRYVGYDPKTCQPTWNQPVAFTAVALHRQPNLRTRVDDGTIFSLYQLESGKWLVGARDAATGGVQWVRVLPRAERGTSFEDLFVTAQRVYVGIDWRIDVFDRKTGQQLGTI